MSTIECGPGEAKCAGNPPKMLCMCPNHQKEFGEDHARRMGVPDLQYSSVDLSSVEGQAKVISEILFNLKARPTKALVIRVIP